MLLLGCGVVHVCLQSCYVLPFLWPVGVKKQKLREQEVTISLWRAHNKSKRHTLYLITTTFCPLSLCGHGPGGPGTSVIYPVDEWHVALAASHSALNMMRCEEVFACERLQKSHTYITEWLVSDLCTGMGVSIREHRCVTRVTPPAVPRNMLTHTHTNRGTMALYHNSLNL